MAFSCGTDAEHGLPNLDIEASGGLQPGDLQLEDRELTRKSPNLRKRRPTSLHFRGSTAGVINVEPDVYVGQDVYLGSYAQSTPRGSVDSRDLHGQPAPSPGNSIGRVQIEYLLRDLEANLNNYGVLELRDGFFGASFSKPIGKTRNNDSRSASVSDAASSCPRALSLARNFFLQQVNEVKDFFYQTTRTRAGSKLLKSFLGVFFCYILCLIPASRDWLGRYNYIIAVSAIINHPGRKVGSQIDGALLSIIGSVAGLSWGSLALYVSTSDATARSGYGGVLAVFLIIFTMVIGWLRCVFIRFYQALLSAGIAIFYMCLADTSESVGWLKVFDFGIPFLLGQALCLLIAILILPETGSRSLAYSIHASLEAINAGLELPRKNTPSLKRSLALQFVDLSTAVRDFVLEIAISRYRSNEIVIIRNLIQAVIRSLLSVDPETTLFENHVVNTASAQLQGEVHQHTADIVRNILASPSRRLIEAMKIAVQNADHVILYLGGQKARPESIAPAISLLKAAKEEFDAADLALLSRPDLPASYAKQPECIELLLFVHPVRQMADKVEAFAQKVLEMQKKDKGWRILPYSYPWKKASLRSNAQVRHDRGGLTAGFYFRSQTQLQRTMDDLQSISFVPLVRQEHVDTGPPESTIFDTNLPKSDHAGDGIVHEDKMTGIRHRTWEIVHRLQGFESRFALKVTLVTILISIPAWLNQSRNWYNENESWWAVVMIWIMMHPRVGGTFQDLVVRMFCAALGAIWAGFAHAAGNGNPYVIGVFAMVYLLPMLYRFTQSSHPRSGLVGCITFTVISLTTYTNPRGQPAVSIAWTRGLAFVVGVFAAIVVNWVLWPFIARHELRKSLAAMFLHSAILYRGVVAKYIYYKDGQEPGPADVVRSEMLEGRLREGFVRIQQLLTLTGHEMRLRAPFDPQPYSALISACESFFEYLVQVRQSSLYFLPSVRSPASSSTAAALISYRRDAVAAILLNLYILACALRAGEPVPKYLPNAAAAREKLLNKMEIVEAEAAARERAEELLRSKSPDSLQSSHSAKVAKERGQRRWADVYEYAFSGALTDIVQEVQEMQRLTREICGETDWE